MESSDSTYDTTAHTKESHSNAKSSLFIVSVMAGMVITGSGSTIILKLTMSSEVHMTIDGVEVIAEFDHPFFMCLLMFIGQTSLFLPHFYYLWIDPVYVKRHELNKANPLLFALPALLECFGAFLTFKGLMLVCASTYQMLQMLSMVFVVLISATVLRQSYSLAQYIAVLIVIGGLTVVTIFDTIYAAC